MNRNAKQRMVKWIVLLAPGAGVLGTSCAEDIRRAVVAAGLDFVEGAAGTALETFIPVDELLSGAEE